MSELPDDWFDTTAHANFELAFLPASNQPYLRHLQIGAFTGNASVWLLENVLTHPTSQLVDVDVWDGGQSYELQEYDFREVERVYDERTKRWRWNPLSNPEGQLLKRKMSSFEFLTSSEANDYDFIYIDGDHSAVSTLENGVLAYRHLKPGGLLCFDDYTWKSKHGMLYEPGIAVDVMKWVYGDRLWVVRVGSQCWLKRVDAEVRR